MKHHALLSTAFVTAFVLAGCQGSGANSTGEDVGQDASSKRSVGSSQQTTMAAAAEELGVDNWTVNSNRVQVPLAEATGTDTGVPGARSAGFILSSYEAKDASGRITIASWRCDASGYNNAQVCTVPKGWVRIGGGAHADYGTGQGALLYISAPCTINGWCAGSKDHYYSNSHTLFTYVIGMKVSGLDSATLQNYVYTAAYFGAQSNRPGATASLPTGFTMLSGGAFLVKKSGDNCLLNMSMPQGMIENYSALESTTEKRLAPGLTWHVSGQDHIYAGTAIAYAYAVGIASSFYDPLNPTVPFRIASEVVAKSKDNASSDAVIFTKPANGHLISGYAGASGLPYYNLRLLYRVGPSRHQDGTYGVIDSKDHRNPDKSGRTYGGQFEFWKY